MILGLLIGQTGDSGYARDFILGRLSHHQPSAELPRGPDTVTAASTADEYFSKFPMNRAASFPEAWSNAAESRHASRGCIISAGTPLQAVITSDS